MVVLSVSTTKKTTTTKQPTVYTLTSKKTVVETDKTTITKGLFPRTAAPVAFAPAQATTFAKVKRNPAPFRQPTLNAE